MIGHLLGAAGAVEAVATIEALRREIVPPTVGWEERDPDLDLDYVPGEARTLERRSNGAGPEPLRRDLELVRLRRPQRGAVHLGMSAPATATPPAVSEASGLALERLELLCDEGTFAPLRTGVLSPALGERAATGDGVVAGAGTVGGRTVFCYAQDPRYLGGSLGAAQADSIVRVMRLAGEAGAPVVGFVESGGARLQEGHDALAGYGRIFRASVELAGRVPQITIVGGVSAGGGAYSPALTDFVVMTESARMFLTGPRVVQAALGEDVSMDELGGPDVHSRNGVCNLVARDDADAVAVVRDLLGLLPGRIGEPPPRASGAVSSGTDPSVFVPESARKVYDVRDVIGTDLRRRQRPRALAELGAQHGHGDGPAGRSARGDRGEPAALPGRRDQHGGGREGGALRGRLRPLRPAARGAGRHPGLHARHPSGAGRSDPPRRRAAALLRRRQGPEAHRGPAQGLRRRSDHDELHAISGPTWSSPGPVPRSGSWPPARRSASSTAASWRTEAQIATSSPTATPRSTLAPTGPRPPATWTR